MTQKTAAIPNALVLTGPTGSGKSALALRLAESLGAEIVSMDSMTLFRGMDIGTAKPSQADRQRAAHHLLDVLDPWESASVAWWMEQATAVCREIADRGRRALFVGGTPLYLKAMMFGLFDGPEADLALRAQLELEAHDRGTAALHTRLAQVDPATAARLHINDLRRIVRALEVFQLTGRPLSEQQEQWKHPDPPVGLRCLWLDRPREELHHRINRRVVQMLDSGWLEEARALRHQAKPLSREALQAIGYSELFAYLEGGAAWEATVEKIQARSRQYAKRQVTWFRHLPGCQAVSIQGDEAPDLLELYL